MNTKAFQEWIGRNSGTPGLLGLGIHAPGHSTLVETCNPRRKEGADLSPQALEKAWRAVTETISVLQLNRFPTARFRFIYASAVVHCERRRDGVCLGIFAQKNGPDFPTAELDRLLTEFHAI